MYLINNSKYLKKENARPLIWIKKTLLMEGNNPTQVIPS